MHQMYHSLAYVVRPRVLKILRLNYVGRARKLLKPKRILTSVEKGNVGGLVPSRVKSLLLYVLHAICIFCMKTETQQLSFT